MFPSEMDMIAGLADFNAKIRVRKAMPRAKAVSEVNDGKTRDFS